MSFLIAVHVNEGIVLASDRRTTYTNTINHEGKVIQRIGIHTTNSTDKSFICPNNSGIATCGDSSLMGKPITGFIQEVIRTKMNTSTSVDDIPQILIDYFHSLPTVPDTNFIVAGYKDSEDGKKEQSLFKVRILQKNIEKIDTSAQGASWDGETLTLTRLIQNVSVKDGDKYIDLPSDDILWGYFTLQDAVDFARYAVETTIQTMRFKNVVETVGGGVDIMVITPAETKWLQKKQLE